MLCLLKAYSNFLEGATFWLQGQKDNHLIISCVCTSKLTSVGMN